MIKGITTIRHAGSAKEFKALSKLFDALGFERGAPWKTARGQGAPFVAPLGQIELVEGLETIHADIWVEVTDLDSIRELLAKEKVKTSAEIRQTSWDSRFLVSEPAKGLKILFWQKDRPAQEATEGDLNARGMRFGVVVSRWNSFITERLLQGAMDALRRSGCREEDITVARVPGAFEIPSQARTLAQSGEYDAIVTLGCLIRGDTTHYEHISTEVTRGIGQSAQETGVPHTYGVLTCENLEQALDRAGLKAGNKGFEAAISAVEMVSLQRKTRGRAKKKGKRK
jgi:6,7-dimethyl-8-ribityllumazine synthase